MRTSIQGLPFYPEVQALAARFHPDRVWRDKVWPRLAALLPGLRAEPLKAQFLKAYALKLDLLRIKQEGDWVITPGGEPLRIGFTYLGQENLPQLRITYRGIRVDSDPMTAEDRLSYLWAWWVWAHRTQRVEGTHTEAFLQTLAAASRDALPFLLGFVANPKSVPTGNWAHDFKQAYTQCRDQSQSNLSDDGCTNLALYTLITLFSPDGLRQNWVNTLQRPAQRRSFKDFPTAAVVLEEWFEPPIPDVHLWAEVLNTGPHDILSEAALKLPSWWQEMGRASRGVARAAESTIDLDSSAWAGSVTHNLEKLRTREGLRKGTNAYLERVLSFIPSAVHTLATKMCEEHQKKIQEQERALALWVTKADYAENQLLVQEELECTNQITKESFAAFYGQPTPDTSESKKAQAAYRKIRTLLRDKQYELEKALVPLSMEDALDKAISTIKNHPELAKLKDRVDWGKLKQGSTTVADRLRLSLEKIKEANDVALTGGVRIKDANTGRPLYTTTVAQVKEQYILAGGSNFSEALRKNQIEVIKEIPGSLRSGDMYSFYVHDDLV